VERNARSSISPPSSAASFTEGQHGAAPAALQSARHKKKSPGNDAGAELMHATNPRSRMRIGLAATAYHDSGLWLAGAGRAERRSASVHAPRTPDSPADTG
jgi:hypothetical protein